MQFTGFCTYPHGCATSAGLLFSTAAALASTTYAIASCRFYVVTFSSDLGSFEQHFSGFRSTGADQVQTYKAAVGLFQWLMPVDRQDWAQGSCVGYQQTMLNALSDSIFNTSRGFAVLAVLLSVVCFLWAFMMSCLDLNSLQICLLAMVTLCGTFASGFTFLFRQSTVCQTAFLSRSCELDQGGMVMIAACILWMVSFLIVTIFLRPGEFPWEGSLAAHEELEAREKLKLAALLERRRAARAAQRERTALEAATPRTDRSVTPPPTAPKSLTRSRTSVSSAAAAATTASATTAAAKGNRVSTTRDHSFDSGDQPSWTSPAPVKKSRTRLTVDDISDRDELEVYISDRLNKIEKIADV